MWPRLSIIAGLLAGVAVAVLVLGGILAFAPEPGSAATPVPVPSVSIPDPLPVARARVAVAERVRFGWVADRRGFGLRVGGPVPYR